MGECYNSLHRPRGSWSSSTDESENQNAEASYSALRLKFFADIWSHSAFPCVCVFSQFSQCFGMGFENFHIKGSAAMSWTPDSLCFNVKPCLFFNCSWVANNVFALLRLMFRLNLDVMANVVHEVGERVSNFIRSFVFKTALCIVYGMCQIEICTTCT